MSDVNKTLYERLGGYNTIESALIFTFPARIPPDK